MVIANVSHKMCQSVYDCTYSQSRVILQFFIDILVFEMSLLRNFQSRGTLFMLLSRKYCCFVVLQPTLYQQLTESQRMLALLPYCT